METERAEWRISLQEPPKVLQAGVGRHGAGGKIGAAVRERYRMPGLWCVHLYTYYGVLMIDRRRFEIRPGRVSLTPPGAELEYQFEGPSTHLYAHFRARSGGKSASTIAAMTDWGADFARFYAYFEQGVGYFAAHRRWADARLWDVLWQLAGRRAAASEGSEHPGVTRVMRYIELHLAEDLRVPRLAELAALSPNHLTRLFRRATGETVKGYICRRRAENAVHLLTRSTLSIKVIARQVGLIDLQAFNKVMHAATGQSPRALRKAAVGT